MITQLVKKFAPAHYDLSLDIDPDKLQFNGHVTIQGQLLHSGPSISLHSKGLELKEVTIDGVSAEITAKIHDEVQLKPKQALKAGEHVLTLLFSGKITDDMAGMYPCYFQHNGQQKKLIATQFESHFAREVFPCIDEPAAKATFSLTLVTPPSIEVLSNTPIRKQVELSGKLQTVFTKTQRMSTYLLAFVCGEMHYEEAASKRGVVVRSWSSIAQPKQQLGYSVQEAVKTVDFFEDYFKTPYPLPKLDQVALPDFDAGAMENWGLITYRESALLTNPQNRSTLTEQYVSIVVAHEISHQWFGNLVTMKWWDDLWLNESFANLMEYVAVDALHPDWQIWEEYTATDVIAASNRDVYSDVQPVRIDVDDPDEISSLFDGAIVYAKGSRILKMLYEYIGEAAFVSALSQYFKKHAYGSATRDDLWEMMEATSKQPVSQVMNSWLEQSGMPLVRVTQVKNKLQLRQKRLLLDKHADKTQLWSIPLLAQGALANTLFETEAATIKLSSNTPVLLNNSASGHYVVDYSSKLSKVARIEGVQKQHISVSGRISAINDTILLAKAGEQTLVSGLDLIKGCEDEPRESVWSLISLVLSHARTLTEGNEQTEEKLKQFTYTLALKRYKNLGWEFAPGEDKNTVHLRRMILGLILSSENKEIIETALKLFGTQEATELNAEIRVLLMSAAVKFGTPEDFDALLALHNATASQDLQIDICAALTTTKSSERAQQLIAQFKDNSLIRPQDIIRWYAYLLRNKHTRMSMWQWTTENWDWILKTFQSSKSYDSFARYSANFFNTSEQLKQYRDFFTPMQSDAALKRTIAIGIKEIEARVKWRGRDQAAIEKWFSQAQ